MENESRKYYLSEFEYYCGTHLITFNIVDINADEITVAITNEGKISRCTFDLKSNGSGLFFEYGPTRSCIAVNDFEQVDETKN